MNIRKLLLFIFQAVAVGLLAAVLLLMFLPKHILDKRLVVEFLEDNTDRPQSLGSGPVSYARAVQRAAPAVVNIYTSKQVISNRRPLLNSPNIAAFFWRP